MESREVRVDRIFTILVSVFVIFMLGARMPTNPVRAQDGKERVEAPEWGEGDKWVYEAMIGPNETEKITERVKKTGIEINPDIEGGKNVKYKDTNQVVLEDEEGGELKNTYYDSNSFSLVYEEKKDAGNLYYHNGRNILNFPLYVGKKWNQTCEVYKEKKGGYEKAHTQYLSGTVLRKNKTKVPAGTFEETYKVNVEMLIKGENSTSRGRTEYYYSPEVKRSVKQRIYEVKKNPRGEVITERLSGTEELVSYNLTELGDDEDNNNNNTPLVGPPLILVAVVSTAILYSKRSEDEHKHCNN